MHYKTLKLLLVLIGVTQGLTLSLLAYDKITTNELWESQLKLNEKGIMMDDLLDRKMDLLDGRMRSLHDLPTDEQKDKNNNEYGHTDVVLNQNIDELAKKASVIYKKNVDRIDAIFGSNEKIENATIHFDDGQKVVYDHSRRVFLNEG